MAENIRTENKMGTLPVGKLLFQISLPMIVSMLIQALYNVVDSIYVSQINESALTAVSLVFPMQTLMVSISSGTAVGVNALVSRFLGEREFDRADNAASHGMFLGLISSAVLAIFFWLIAPPFMHMQTSDPVIFEYGVTYLQICGVLCVGIFMEITFERLLNSTGKTFLSMISQTTGAVLNIIFDPILIFGIGPFPEMGVAGAAAATVFGQIVAAILALIFNLKWNKEIHPSFRNMKLSGKMVGEIYRIGIPSILMISIGSVMVFCMNLIFMQYLNNSTAAAVFGVYFKLNSLFFMPIFGLNNGLVPIVAYNYGAKHRKRITKTIRLSIIAAVIMMGIGTLCFLLIPKELLALFNASEHMMAIGVPALRITCLGFMLAGYCFVLVTVMQAVGNAFYSMLHSLARQLLVLVPVSFLLATIFRAQGGLPEVWFAFFIADLSAFVIATLFFRKTYHEKLAQLPD